MRSPNFPLRRLRELAVLAAFITLAAAAAAAAVGALPATPQAGFAAENDAAMAKMMAGMHIKSSGGIDADFAAMMIAHHQGAIEMAEAELRYGSNEQLRRIAQEIVVEQQQEIAAMHLALGRPLPPSAAAPMSQRGSPEGEYRSAQHEGTAVSTPQFQRSGKALQRLSDAQRMD